MNDYNKFNIDQESKAELITKYIDGTYEPSELVMIETLLANDNFSLKFFESMTAIDASLVALSSTSLSSKITSDITHDVLNKYTIKQHNIRQFKSYEWHIVAASFILLSIIGLYSINNSNQKIYTTIYNDWGNYIVTFYMIGTSAVLLLLFDMLLKHLSKQNQQYKHI